MLYLALSRSTALKHSSLLFFSPTANSRSPHTTHTHTVSFINRLVFAICVQIENRPFFMANRNGNREFVCIQHMWTHRLLNGSWNWPPLIGQCMCDLYSTIRQSVCSNGSNVVDCLHADVSRTFILPYTGLYNNLICIEELIFAYAK